MTSHLELIAVVLMAVGVLFLLLRVSEFPVLAAGLIAATPIFTIFLGNATPGFEFAGLNIYYEDIVTVVLMLQVLYRIPTLQRWKNAHFLYIMFGIFTAFVLYSILRGVQSFPIKKVIIETRMWLFPISTIYYFTSVRLTRKQLEKIGTVIEWASLALIVITLIRYGLLATGHLTSFSDTDSEDVHRPVPAGTAMFMASCAMYLWYRIVKGKASAIGKFAGAVLPFLVVLVQHRSVWSAFAVMLILAYVFGIEMRGKARNFVAICACGLVALVLFAPNSGPVKSLSTSVATTSGESSTYEWRQQGWRELLKPSYVGNTLNYTIGMPMGNGFWRRLTVGKDTYFTGVAPHNLFVMIILRCGGIGLIAFVGFMLVSLFRLILTKDLEYRVLAIISMGVIVYWWAYVFDEPQGFFLALGIRLLIGLTDEPERIRDESILSLGEKSEQSAIAEPAIA